MPSRAFLRTGDTIVLKTSGPDRLPLLSKTVLDMIIEEPSAEAEPCGHEKDLPILSRDYVPPYEVRTC